MTEKHIKTYVKGVKEKVEDLEQGDIVYVQKKEGDYTTTYEVSFMGIEKGLVMGRVKRSSWNGNNWIDSPFGAVIKARKTSCYIWGIEVKMVEEKREFAHWFK